MMSRMMKWSVVILAGVLMPAVDVFSQPGPGDVFREYMWYKQDGDAGGSLRVGGRVGYEGSIALDHDFDLEHATGAEVVVEKILCHDGTTGLAIRINEGDSIRIPEAAEIPAPQCDYQHHFYPTVRIPLSCLKRGRKNEFRMTVDAEHPWNWPQNLINGVHFRVYYDPAKKPHPRGQITGPRSGETLGKSVILTAEASSPNGPVKQVDYIGLYDDVNFEGDGVYINDSKVFDNEGPKYAYFAHRVTIADISCLKQGVNILKTDQTPKIDGTMVHGMEVNWPGIMVLIQYNN